MHKPTLLLATLGLAAPLVLAACTREFLQGVTTAYIQAVGTGKPDGLLALTSSNSTFKYIENDIPLDITKQGVIGGNTNSSTSTTRNTTIDFHRSVYDVPECSTYTELNTASAPHPYVIHTIIRVDPTTSKITTIDSVVSDEGDWIFNATLHLNFTRQENWDVILPESKRDSREVIKAAGDAYLNQWGNSTLPVPLGTPCARLEGGLYTGSRDPGANTCRMPAFPQPLNVKNRRYVIDVDFGTVGILNDFPWLEATRPNGSTPSSNMFRVEGGLIRYIHEVTVCITRNCGR